MNATVHLWLVDLRRGTGGRLWWSSSSAGALFVVAGADAPIGVDVEPVRPAAEWAAVARRHFAAEEIAALAGSAERFARYWTLKEAYLKGLGLGLLGGLDRLRCDTLTSEADGWLVAPGHPEWRFAAVPLPDGGVACAVALRGRAAVPEVHRYAPVVEPGRRS